METNNRTERNNSAPLKWEGEKIQYEQGKGKCMNAKQQHTNTIHKTAKNLKTVQDQDDKIKTPQTHTTTENTSLKKHLETNQNSTKTLLNIESQSKIPESTKITDIQSTTKTNNNQQITHEEADKNITTLTNSNMDKADTTTKKASLEIDSILISDESSCDSNSTPFAALLDEEVLKSMRSKQYFLKLKTPTIPEFYRKPVDHNKTLLNQLFASFEKNQLC